MKFQIANKHTKNKRKSAKQKSWSKGHRWCVEVKSEIEFEINVATFNFIKIKSIKSVNEAVLINCKKL